jgi:hypothetical protein
MTKEFRSKPRRRARGHYFRPAHETQALLERERLRGESREAKATRKT